MSVDTRNSQVAPVDQYGILSAWVRQPVANSPSENNGIIIYTEKWKAPYSTARSICSSVGPGMLISAVHNALGTKVEYTDLSYPECPTRNNIAGQWTLYTTNVEELVDGNHAIVTFAYKASFGYSVLNLTEDPYGDVWSISWSSYSVSPFAFCSEEDHVNDTAEPKRPSIAAMTMNYTYPASRANVEKYVKGETRGSYQVKSNDNLDTMYAYPDDAQGKNFKYLAGTESAIYKKYALGKSAVYHYPVVTHQTVKKGPFSANQDFDDTLGEGLDHFVASLSSLNCPYKFNTDTTKGPVYKWLKVADDMTLTKNKTNTTFTRREQWWGIVDPDINFYGDGALTHTRDGILSGRWEIGKL